MARCGPAARASGLIAGRPYDAFGVGFYNNAISNNFKNSITRLTEGTASAEDERSVELFYDFAITPAVRLNVSYQHVWNPLIAKVVENQNNASLFDGMSRDPLTVVPSDCGNTQSGDMSPTAGGRRIGR